MTEQEAQIEELRDRVADIEKKLPSPGESRYLRFGALAGVVGTVISIIAGGIAVYGDTIRKTSEDREAAYTQFSSLVDELNADNAKISDIVSSGASDSEKLAQTQQVASRRYYVLGEARHLYPKLGRVDGIPDMRF
ncbi:hypothetical protein [Acidisoma sp. S159]|uniref:hypothetical protein n=1 Tax=Acidisoma sp. S159 TaxID=1747225 RepID=UPI00131ACDD3|nr:hypothetical protein [Acidisoma sp. S159]